MRSFVARRTLAAAAGVLLALGAAGAFAEQQATQQQPAAQQPAPQQVAATNEAEISIQSFQFVPAILTVKAGKRKGDCPASYEILDTANTPMAYSSRLRVRAGRDLARIERHSPPGKAMASKSRNKRRP